MTTYILKDISELHAKLNLLPDNEFVVMRTSLLDIPVTVTLENRIVKGIFVESDRLIADDQGKMIPANEYAHRFLNLSRTHSAINTDQPITLYGLLRVSSSPNHYVQTDLVFTDFTITGLHVSDYSSRLALLVSWGFKVPLYLKVPRTNIGKSCIELSGSDLYGDHLCVINNTQHLATHVYCVPIN